MFSSPIQLTVLGSGTSMGVPSLGCHCPVCKSSDPHNKRLRPSLLLSRNGENVVIDTTPDFRQQALRVGIDRLDAVLLTHGHADHIHGFDDVRPFSMRQKAPLPVYGNTATFQIVRRAFSYIFDEGPKLSSVPSVELRVIKGPFELLGTDFIPVPLIHGNMEVLGFRFGRAAYLTDFSSIPHSSMPLLEDLDVLILDALRDEPHPMHQTVAQALSLIARLKPRQAWFTHIAHELSHAETNERLRAMGKSHVQLAYDGLQLKINAEKVRERGTVLRADTSSSSSLAVFSSAREWHSRYAATGRGSVLSIGNFDGLHLGHQTILRAVVARAREMQAVATVLTFEPPPMKVLRPEAAPKRLSTSAQRTNWIREFGLEAAVVLPFTLELAKLTPEAFVEQILIRDLCARVVLVGENFRFGHKQAGDTERLRELGKKYGFEVVTIAPVVYRGETVSSTIIRREITAGNVARAGRMLRRPFALTGEIVRGTGTGSRLTFPTLNLLAEQELLPARGVYITRALLEGEVHSHRSVTNIGVRPTFNGTSLSVETHLLASDYEINTNRMELRFWRRLREERKFPSPEELRAQIARDISAANHFFNCLRYYRTRQVSS